MIEIKNLYKKFNDKIIYDNFSITFDDDKVNCIVGESGGGKSTLLNIISGLMPYDSGDIAGIDFKDVSYVFQEDRLIPWLNIKKNMELFIYNYYEKEEAISNINNIFEMLNIKDTFNKYPNELSGGMKQRVNIARAILKPSKLILMDEPFKSLDYKTKYNIMKDFKEILKVNKRMVIFVTHDVDECIYLGGKIYVLGGNPFCIKSIYSDNIEKKKDEIISLI